MRRVGPVVGALALVLGASGCWLQPRLEPGRSNSQAGERTLTAETVGGLTQLWSTAIGTETNRGAVLAPVALNGRLYVAAYGNQSGSDFGYTFSAALDAATGERVWQTRHQMLTVGFRIVLDDPVIQGGRLHAPSTLLINPNGTTIGGDHTVDLSTGESVPLAGGSSQDLAVVDGEIVRKKIETAVPGRPPDPYTTTVTGPGFRPTVAGSAAIPGDYAFVGGSIAWSDGATSATGYSPQCPESGGVPRATACSPDWTTDLGAAPGNPTAVGDQQVVYADASGTVTVLDMADGTVAWRAELGPTALSQPTVTADEILVGTGDGRLVALPRSGCGAATCEPSWTGVGTGSSPGTVLAAGDVAYVAGETGAITAYDRRGCGAATCDPLASVSTGSAITGSPIVHDGRLVVGTADSRVVAFGLPAPPG